MAFSVHLQGQVHDMSETNRHGSTDDEHTRLQLQYASALKQAEEASVQAYLTSAPDQQAPAQATPHLGRPAVSGDMS